MEQTKNFESKADGGSIGIEVLFQPKRQNLFMGGPALEGEALSIYNSMNTYGATDQEIADRLTSLGLYDPNASTPPGAGDNIIGSQINQGGGGGGGIMDLQKTYRTLPGDPKNYRLSQLEGNSDYFPPTTMLGKTKNFIQEKFFQPRIKGTLGDRLLKQSQSMTIPTLAGAFAKLRSPFNPQSPTYNAALPMQLNFLEATTGKKITGTSDNLNFTDASMIGRDPNSGLLKYGPGSVLAGKNVISGFGSNDYETALNKYLTRMSSYTNPTKFQQEKIKQAQKELAALQAKTEQEYIDSGKKAEVAALQKEIDSGKYSGGSNFAQSNQAAVGGGSKAKNKQGQTAAQATKAGTGTSQGYSQHYARGGLATMFTRRR